SCLPPAGCAFPRPAQRGEGRVRGALDLTSPPRPLRLTPHPGPLPAVAGRGRSAAPWLFPLRTLPCQRARRRSFEAVVDPSLLGRAARGRLGGGLRAGGNEPEARLLLRVRERSLGFGNREAAGLLRRLGLEHGVRTRHSVARRVWLRGH